MPASPIGSPPLPICDFLAGSHLQVHLPSPNRQQEWQQARGERGGVPLDWEGGLEVTAVNPFSLMVRGRYKAHLSTLASLLPFLLESLQEQVAVIIPEESRPCHSIVARERNRAIVESYFEPTSQLPSTTWRPPYRIGGLD